MTDNRTLVNAIDLGTSRTGYGFAWVAGNENDIIANKPWKFCPSYIKTLTVLLLNKEDLSFKVLSRD